MTTQLAPETIFNDLLQQIIVGLRRPYTEMELKRLEKAAEPLRSIDSGGWHEVRSSLASLRGDYDHADQAFENALKNTGAEASLVMRQLFMCASLGRNARVKELADRFAYLLRNDPLAVEHTSSLLAGAGYVHSARRFYSEIHRLVPDAPKDAYSFPIELKNESDVEALDIGEELVSEVVTFAHNFLRSSDASPVDVRTSVVRFEDGKLSLHYRFGVDASYERASELEWSLFEKLGENEFVAEESDVVSFSVVAGGD